ncbi:MAG: lipocalin family protein [Saprospiraceae bacterium]|nr:lipocalin family protein [Saprospiraceae bacterium]
MIRRLWLPFLLFAAFISCKRDPGPTADQLVGRWELQSATRDGRPTESLEELYYEFLPDGTLRTNMSGAPETATYAVEKNILQQRQGRIEADYTIEELSDSVLILSANIRSFAFQFKLARRSSTETLQ